MITVRCPTCDAAYQLDAAKLEGGGRKLRCAKCQTVWLARVEVAPVEPAVSPIEDDMGMAQDIAPVHHEHEDGTDDLLVQRTPGLDAVTHVGGWRRWVRGENAWRNGALAFILLGLMAGGVAAVMNMGGDKAEVAHEEMPEDVHGEAEVSDVVQPPAGVVLHRVQGEVTPVEGDGGGVALTVRGLLANTTSATVAVPPLRLELLGENGVVTDQWPVSTGDGELPAHDEQAWTVSLTAPDLSQVKGWRVVFVKAEQE